MNVFPSPMKALLLVAATLSISSCAIRPEPDIRSLTVIYTNDEHGYMQGIESGMDAARLVSLWQQKHGYQKDGSFLLLSGGDNWTGPAISSWTRGESMMEVMNAMGYDASAVGNHEFDFGLQSFRQRTQEAEYPYLSANTRWKASGEVPRDLGILPYDIQTVNGIRVAIIGLTTRDTPYTTHPANVGELRFADYQQSLRETLPNVMQQRPNLVFVIAHVCLDEINALAKSVADLNIDLMGAGHCNELTATTIGDTVILGGGYHLGSYATADFRVDLNRDLLIDTTFATHQHNGAELQANSSIATIISRWNAKFKDVLNENLTFSAEEIPQRSPALEQAVVSSWLQAFPDADVAITNRGGLRTPLPAGDIKLKHLVEFMPFENTIISLKLTGSELETVLKEGGKPVVGGMSLTKDRWHMTSTGQPLKPEQPYKVLVNSFMYSGGDNFSSLAKYNPEGVDSGIHYRQPFVEWLRKQPDVTALNH